MGQIVVRPGDVVVTNMGVYQHWSIVSNRLCKDGFNMLISASRRTGTVMEEPWLNVTQGKDTYVADYRSELAVHKVLAAARSQIGKWSYSVTTSNCEHFVKWATGMEVTSTQVKAGVAGATVGALAVAALSEKPKSIKFLGGALLVGGLAVMATKAIEKSSDSRVDT